MGQARVEGEEPGGIDPDGPGGPGSEFRERILSLVRERAARVAGFGEPTLPADGARLHEMRKAAKRLRYTLEIFAPFFGGADGALAPHIKRVKALQDALGAVRDRDVWIAFLPDFIERERRRTLAYQGHVRGFGRVARGVARFEAAAREGRETAFADFAALWDKLRKGRWWKDLLDSLGAA
jgi:CHAD domain-containing protein